ncbi:hypothetical protein EYF80_022387 [Liparis tanakae]|uniref:Uncharacterized protein n=1 Tax=Liparis tanakae TaxID=230148 RepID=A0A4Z2HPE0_9TELE|nr:hypothetical protein EYF80_022387 [Liparis tanakae]
MSRSSSLYIAGLNISQIIAIVWLPMTEGSGAKFKETKEPRPDTENNIYGTSERRRINPTGGSERFTRRLAYVSSRVPEGAVTQGDVLL